MGEKEWEEVTHTKEELIKRIKMLRNKKKAASSTLWTYYCMVNSVIKINYAFDLKSYFIYCI